MGGGPNQGQISASSSPQAALSSSDLSIRELQRADQVAFADATTMSQVAGMFRAQGRSYRIRRSSVMKLADLREGPVILIGAFNNEWTLRLAEPLRFSFVRSEGAILIKDREDSGRQWAVDPRRPYAALQEDYALISRTLDPITGRLVIIAGGLTKYGTSAAGEFLTDPIYMEALRTAAPRGWDGKNVQVVIATKVVGENSGPPRILASYFW
jgi:hypothetical protein